MTWRCQREFQAAINLDPKFATAHYDLARCLYDMHDAEGAIREFQVAIKVFPHYAFPGQLNFPQAHFGLGNALLSKNDEEGAIREYQASLRIDPNNAYDHNWVAWELATHPDLKICDPDQAINLAKRAVELKPTEAAYWTTLGAAYYRAGDWKEAVAALEKSSELPNGGDSFNWFFLAMSHEKLGDKETARRWYDRATQWKDTNQATKEKLLRIRAEAAQALGVDRSRD